MSNTKSLDTWVASIPEDGRLSLSEDDVSELSAFDESHHTDKSGSLLKNIGISKETIDFTATEIEQLPQKNASSKVSTQLTNAAKAIHLFKDRKKKRVDENHRHFLTAHCIRDGIKHTTANANEFNEAQDSEIKDDKFRMSMRAMLPVTKGVENDAGHEGEELPDDTKDEVKSTISSVTTSSSSFASLMSNWGSKTKRFEFKEYAPAVFLKLRNHWGISQENYMESLASEEMYLEFQSNSKSGQFFFFSDDKKFMIKTLTTQEANWFSDCLPRYYEHLMNHPDSLLVKFVGMYRVRVPRQGRKFRKKIHFVVMRSTFDTALPMHKKFDLKGSRVGRQASANDKKKMFPVLKDLDLENSGLAFHFSPNYKATFLKQLETDAGFLASLKMMDYSLLIGIFDRKRVDPRHGIDDDTIRAILEEDKCLHSIDELDSQGLVYFVGIIDILQQYNANKKIETVTKTVLGNDRKDISSVSPSFYSERLVRFITSFVG